MTKAEALSFLELGEDATDQEIKKTLEEQIARFEQLSDKAPSDFLRKMNAQKLAKARGIQEDLKKWAPQASGAKSVILNDEPEDDAPVVEEDLPATTPIIISSGSRFSKKNAVPEPLGWLVRHTENQSAKTYSLWKGSNYIGRKLHESLKPFLVIEEDLYISRVHALITAETGDQFYIEDSAAANHGTESKNGTYLNGRDQRITGKTRLNENDTIQIGVTKLILRYNNHPIQKIVKEVEKSKFMHTVALEL